MLDNDNAAGESQQNRPTRKINRSDPEMELIKQAATISEQEGLR